jgi:A nuclease family of the HNH/ENDO VII superfamily with conserved AHH
VARIKGGRRIPVHTIARGAAALRKKLPFRAVNCRDTPGYLPGMQRHHLLPKQLLKLSAFGRLFDNVGRERIGFDDFRTNGLLLPASDEAALRVRMPMHRGPHRDYNGLVAERVGQIESDWSKLRLRAPEIALEQALMRLDLLQRALRRRLLADDRPQMRLNRRDPVGQGVDFAELDAMADALWAGTAPPVISEGGLPTTVLPPPTASQAELPALALEEVTTFIFDIWGSNPALPVPESSPPALNETPLDGGTFTRH